MRNGAYVDLSVPDVLHPAVCPTTAILDSGAELKISQQSFRIRSRMYMQVGRGGDGRNPAAEGRRWPSAASETINICPTCVSLNTTWGPVVLDRRRRHDW